MPLSAPVITIAIITRERPQSLQKTLRSLQELILPPVEVGLLVVDNDPNESARHMVESFAKDAPFAVRYCMEAQKGIPAARNRALQEAAQSEYLAFIDDDDTADAQWLNELYHAALSFNAQVVAGKVEYQFLPGKEYLCSIDLFAPREMESGTALASAWTTNVLLDLALHTQNHLRFDPAFTQTGGSDHHFFQQAAQGGARVVFCREAIVYSPVSEQRSSWRWLIRRNMRVGATLTLSEIKQHGIWAAACKLPAALCDSTGYFFRLMKGVFKGEVKFIHPAMVGFFMLGRLLGLFHLSPREYR